MTEEAKVKETKQKTTIERLKKQVEDLTQKNKEQADELKHLGELVRQASTPAAQRKDKPASGIGQGASRYTFSSKPPEEQPKGILKNKNEGQHHNTSPCKSDDQDQDYQEEDDDQELHHEDAEDDHYEHKQIDQLRNKRYNSSQGHLDTS